MSKEQIKAEDVLCAAAMAEFANEEEHNEFMDMIKKYVNQQEGIKKRNQAINYALQLANKPAGASEQVFQNAERILTFLDLDDELDIDHVRLDTSS